MIIHFSYLSRYFCLSHANLTIINLIGHSENKNMTCFLLFENENRSEVVMTLVSFLHSNLTILFG